MKALILAAALLTASVASADAVVGKHRFLVGGRQNAFWVPVGGGKAEMIIPGQVTGLSPKNQSYTSVATDGDRFLVAYCGAGVALYEEGVTYAPLSVTPLEGVASRCFAQWDGSRYVVAWNTEGDARIAALTRDGTIIVSSTVHGLERVAGMAINGDRILLLHARGYVSSNFIGVPPDEIGVRAIVLDSHFTLVKESTIGLLYQTDPHQEVFSAVPFGTGFYVAWYQGIAAHGQWHPNSQVLGTRISVEGEPLDVGTRVDPYGEPMLGGRILQRNVDRVIDVELVAEADHVVALMKYDDDTAAPVNGVFIGADGLHLGSREILQARTERNGVFTRLDTVRLANGQLVAVSMVGGEATILPVVMTPPALPRRRAVR